MYKILTAEFSVRRGHLDVAVRNFMEATRETRHPEIARRATAIAVFGRDDAAALEAAEIWVNAAPDDSEARQIAAAMYVREGNAEAARTQLEEMLSRSPEAAGQNLRMIAGFLSRERDSATALEVMRLLVEKRQGNPDALLAYATLASRAGRPEEARATLDRVVAMGQVSTPVALSYVALLQQQGELNLAVSWLEENLKQRPEDFELRLIYARLLADARRYEEARVQFSLLLEAQPENPDVLYTLGLLDLQSNRIDEAERHFGKLVELRAENLNQANYYLGQIAESRKDAAGALTHYRAVTSGTSYFEAQLRIAFLLSADNRLTEARAHLQGVTPRTDRESSLLTQAEGEILTNHKRYTEAMAVYDAALYNHFDSELLYIRAMLAEKMDRLDWMERDLRAILARDPDDPQALNALGYTLADRTNRHEEALKLVERALELSPDDFYILDSMGWVLYRLGRLEEARDYLEKARALRDDPEVAAHLGEVLWVMGRKEAARDVWDSALKMTPGDEKLLEVIERLEP